MGKVGVDYVVGFVVRNGDGSPRTGIAASITPRVRALDTAVDDGSVAAVVEIGNGRYSLIIRGAFTTAQGAGNYQWQAEITAVPLDVGGGTLRFTDADTDDIATPADVLATEAAILAAIAALNDPTAAAIADAVWARSIDDGEFSFPAAGRVLNRVFRYGTLPRRLNLTTQKLEIGEDDTFAVIVQSWDMETISGPPQLVIDQFGSPAVRLDPDVAF